MVALGTDAGVHTVALLTDMSTPLGLTVGNAIEVAESVEVLAGGGPADVVELTLALAREMLAGAGVTDVDPADKLADGSAMDAGRPMIRAQGGDPDAALPARGSPQVVAAPASGTLTRLDAMAVGMAAWRLGAGRARKEDPVQAGAGVVWHARPGDRVTEGQPLFTLLTDEPGALRPRPGLARGRVRRGPRWTERVVVRADAGAARPRRLRSFRERTPSAQPSSSTTVSATQAGFGASSISMIQPKVTCLPAGTSVTSASVAWARMREPTGTGAGKRTLLSP